MDRITNTQLNAIVDRINRATNSPMTPYTKNADGKHTANIGNYHLDWAYGGVCLQRMDNDAGGVNTPLGIGHVTKRALRDAMYAYIAGINDAKMAA